MTDTLTQADVARLLADPSPETRADMAAKVAREFERGELTPDERRIAEEIVRAMARDAALRVRQALAERDAAIMSWRRRHRGKIHVFEDRRLELASALDIDVETQMQRLMTALRQAA